MPQQSKQTIQRLCLEAVQRCGSNVSEIIRFVEARVNEMTEEDRLELDRNVQLLLSFEPVSQTPKQ